MFGFDTVDSLVKDLADTASKLNKLAAEKAVHASRLREHAAQLTEESFRAERVAGKLDKLLA